VTAPRRLSIAQARRAALAAQGFHRERPSGRVDRRHLRRAFDDMGIIQIDSVNVLVRSQELPLFARLGPHDRSLIPAATAAGEIFEYWVHEASHVPVSLHQFVRWRMQQPHGWKGVNQIVEANPGLVKRVLNAIEDRGPMTAAELSPRTAPKSDWWDWDAAKAALEFLFWKGEIAATRRSNDFARLYDLPERVLPTAALAAATPDESDARSELIRRAVRHLGIGTLKDIADYHRQRVGDVQPLVEDLVRQGELVAISVEGWPNVAYASPQLHIPREVAARALLSPFDPVVWFRDRDERLYDFYYRIEIYTPAAKRRYGYYVLPFLLGDRIVGRFDLKADRANRVLKVQASWVEESDDTPTRRLEIASEAIEELQEMSFWLGLTSIEIVERGSLAKEMRIVSA
jgi:uncharacterized protein